MTDVFWLLLLAVSALSVLVYARPDPHHKHPTPGEVWNRIHAGGRPVGWRRRTATIAWGVARLLGWLVYGLFLAAVFALGETAKVVICAAVAIWVSAAWLLAHAAVLARPYPSAHPELTHLTHEGAPS